MWALVGNVGIVSIVGILGQWATWALGHSRLLCCSLPLACCSLPLACCALPLACCALPLACCALPFAFSVSVVCCVLCFFDPFYCRGSCRPSLFGLWFLRLQKLFYVYCKVRFFFLIMQVFWGDFFGGLWVGFFWGRMGIMGLGPLGILGRVGRMGIKTGPTRQIRQNGHGGHFRHFRPTGHGGLSILGVFVFRLPFVLLCRRFP